MPWIRRKWTPVEADEWTREDWMVIVLSPLSYFALAIGVALSILLMWQGFVVLFLSIVLIVLMHWIIDPKLQAISHEYEKKQQQYLDELEETMHWK